VKFGTMITGASFRAMPEVARTYEDNGLESLWMPEHLVFPAEMPALYPLHRLRLPGRHPRHADV
jgi:alkanesulfonate monooxygenase SsuD/methylene tetrahydromethanopterin reductase-like flavin-dependent oxidoreductase (luciferase family)